MGDLNPVTLDLEELNVIELGEYLPQRTEN